MTDTLQPADPQMVAYYAARASEYDRIYLKPERQADIAELREGLPTLFAGKRVLEVACGTGFWTQFIAPQARAMVALDAAPETMAIAAHRVAPDSVRFVQGDAYALPADLGVFDAAFAGFWFSHVPQSRQREFLRGLGAVLAPGATVVLLDNRYVAGSSTPIAETDADGDSYQLRTLDDGTIHRVLKNFPTQARLHQLLEGLGEQPVLTQLTYYWVLQYQVAAQPT
ncbi:MAG: class I SAM-dependent methyltransferase [Betaproteobacteria bacterium]